MFTIIDKYDPDCDSAGLECKYLVELCKNQNLTIDRFIEERCGFDLKSSIVTRTLFNARLSDYLHSGTKRVYSALVKKAEANGRSSPSPADLQSLLSSYYTSSGSKTTKSTDSRGVEIAPPAKIMQKLVRKFLENYSNYTSLKDTLNTLGRPIGVVFSDPSHTLTLGQLNTMCCDNNGLLTSPECRVLFNYIHTKYDSP